MIRSSVFFCFLILVFACKKDQEKNPLFTKVKAEHSNIFFQNILTPTNDLNILDYLYYYNGGGVAVGDINNDNLPDIYFTSNQQKNKLYLNKGNFVFEDITEKAGVAGNSDWNTGVTMADVNADGFLDIYVCAVTGIHGLKGKNELFINNGNNTFTEKAKEFGLGFQNYSTTAAFFDYDNDDDLDMYLLNHAVHTQNSFGKAEIRFNRDEKSGDKLMRNDDRQFIDVSEQAGIFGGSNGYGLGIATHDFNNDGYTDIYISNDFHEDDYYYLNNGDGTFSEELKKYFGKTSRFSMGNDVSDINHDGFTDILTLDMLPEDEKVLKSSVGDETIDMLKMRTERLGYHYQFARNMLQINKEDHFAEAALYSNVAATDWSWSALFSDFNQDGEQDLFISNGIPKRPNDLDYIKYVSNEKIKEQLNSSNLVDNEALDIMPSGAVPNYIFKGSDNLKFIDKSKDWFDVEKTMSTGSAYADFDNDGDLDLVTNNINKTAIIYKNTIDSTNHLKLRFSYKKGNSRGIGTKAIVYYQGYKQYKQLFTSKGFQSSSEAILHFGLSNIEQIDSLKIIWPDNTVQVAENVKVNQSLLIKPLHKRFPVNYQQLFPKKKTWFTKVDSIKGLNFIHKENDYIDVNRHKLIPYQLSDRGPAVAVGDLNNDGKDDIFFGSARNEISKIYFQKDKGFEKQDFQFLKDGKLSEDVAAIIKDFNNDQTNDLFVANGGGEYTGKQKQLLDKIYFGSKEEIFNELELTEYYDHAAVIKALDVDNDGDLDIFLGNHVESYQFGELPDSYLLINNNSNFEYQKIESLGMVTDAIITDFNNDKQPDIIAVGEWMSPVFLQNTNGQLKDVTNQYLDEELNGLWQSLIGFDIDNDGDTDYVLGNFGLNTKFKASVEFPMKMYVGDFDNNNRTETLVAIEKNEKYYTLQGLDELTSQLNYLKKKYTVYDNFSGQNLKEIFGEEALNKSNELLVHELSSGVLKNENGVFKFYPFLNADLQIAPISAMLKYDFNKDGNKEILLAGNYFGVTPYHGKFDSFSGALLQKNNKIISSNELGVNFSKKAVKQLNIFNFDGSNYILVTINDNEIEVYKIPN